MRLEVLKRQLAKGGLVGDGEPAGAEVDDVVGADGEAVGTITAPEVSVRVDPQTGGVIVVEGTATDEGVGTGGPQVDPGVTEFVEEEARYWYAKRLRIETFFSDQKSRGFHLSLAKMS